MAAPLLEFRDVADALLSGTTDEPGAIGGTPTTAVIFRIYNNFGGAGADTAHGYRLHVVSKDSGDADNPVSSGHEFVDRRYFEVRITGGLGGLVAPASSWQRIGSGLSFPFPSLAQDQGVTLESRVSGPGDAPTFHPLPTMQIRGGEAVQGAGEWPNGIFLGPGGLPQILLTSDVVENPGGADADVQVQSSIWQAPDPTHVIVQQLVTLDANDADSVALASGEEYRVRIVLAADGTIAQRKGLLTTTPSSESDEGALDVGDLELAMAIRQFDGIVNDADITNRWVQGAFGWKSDAALVATIGGGSSHVGQALVEMDFESPVTLANNDTNWIWIQPDGTFGVTQTDSPPSFGSMKIWTAVTSAGVVTSFSDLRVFKGVLLFPVVFYWTGAITTASIVSLHWPHPAPGRLRGISPVSFSIPADWAGTGALIGDLETSPDGITWTSKFPTSPDQRPTIPNGSVLDVDSIPDDLVIEAGELLRFKIDAIPTGGTDPAEFAAIALVELG